MFMESKKATVSPKSTSSENCTAELRYSAVERKEKSGVECTVTQKHEQLQQLKGSLYGLWKGRREETQKNRLYFIIPRTINSGSSARDAMSVLGIAYRVYRLNLRFLFR